MALLKATKREQLGTRKVQQLRKEGKVPCVLYGHGEESQPLTLNEHEVELAILHGERLLEIQVGRKKQNALIKEVQYDTFGHHVLHVDLARVDLDERVEVTVRVTLKGTPVGVAEESGVLQQVATEVRIECAVQAIPEEISVMVTDLKVGETLTMGDLPLAEGATLLDDPEVAVATVRFMAEEAEAPVEEEEPEPEVIGEEKEAAEEGEAAPAEGGA